MSANRPTDQRRARICMPTWRRFTCRAFQCGLYEAQDVLLGSDDVDMICLEPAAGFRFKERWQRRLLCRDPTKKFMSFNPGLNRVRLTQDYDLFVAVCFNIGDVVYLNAIDGWKDRCKTSVCWIDELWAASIPGYRNWLDTLSWFDHVFIGCRGSVDALSRAIGRSCRWLPGAVDAIRFSPYPRPPARVIDVYSIGRRWEGMHEAFLALASQKQIFYVHDTFAGSNIDPLDPQQHRELFANMAKRSRFFTVAPGKMDLPETQGQIEVGYRYYEGAAAGGVMVGQTPDCEAFREMFDWPDAIIEMRTDGSDVAEVLSHLASQRDRLRAISQRNATEALLRHDWMYRWKELITTAGLEISPQMKARERRLEHLAALAANGESERTSARSLTNSRS